MSKKNILCHHRPMKWVGLTGGIASGKTTVANVFRELGVPVIDADQLAHSALEKNKEKIATYFGRDVINDQGDLDRRLLGQRVFKNEKQLKTLESMIHPYVREKVKEKKRLFEVSGEKLVIYDVPLLFEKEMQADFDEIIVVYVPEEVSKQRLMERNGLTLEEAEARIGSQMDIEKKKELAHVTFLNEGDRDELKAQVQDYFRSQAQET